MTNIVFTFISATLFALIVNFILKKNRVLLNFSGQNHQCNLFIGIHIVLLKMDLQPRVSVFQKKFA